MVGQLESLLTYVYTYYTYRNSQVNIINNCDITRIQKTNLESFRSFQWKDVKVFLSSVFLRREEISWTFIIIKGEEICLVKSLFDLSFQVHYDIFLLFWWVYPCVYVIFILKFCYLGIFKHGKFNGKVYKTIRITFTSEILILKLKPGIFWKILKYFSSF